MLARLAHPAGAPNKIKHLSSTYRIDMCAITQFSRHYIYYYYFTCGIIYLFIFIHFFNASQKMQYNTVSSRLNDILYL